MCDPAPRLFIFTLLLRRHESMNPNGQPADVPGILYADIILACMSGAYNLDPNYWLVGGQGLPWSESLRRTRSGGERPVFEEPHAVPRPVSHQDVKEVPGGTHGVCRQAGGNVHVLTNPGL